MEERKKRRSAPAVRNRSGFFAELLNLMAKQCIFAAMIFAAIYFIKHSNLPFFKTISDTLKGVTSYNISFGDAIEFVRGIFS